MNATTPIILASSLGIGTFFANGNGDLMIATTNRRSITAVTASLLAISMLAACTGDGDSSSTTAAPSTTPAPATTLDVAPSTTAPLETALTLAYVEPPAGLLGDLATAQRRGLEDAVNEIRIMASIKHKNIVRYCDAFVERDNLYIAMEFAEHGDISRQVDKFKAANKYIKEDIIWSYLLQMCNGLALMHSRNVLHRDIKPKNVFLTGKNHIRLGDLGCAKLMKSGMARTQIGAFATLQHTQKRIRAHCRRLPVSFLFCINISLRAPYA